MSRSMRVFALLLSLLLAAICPAIAVQSGASTDKDKAEWIAFLTKADQMDATTYQKVFALSRLAPEEAYAILKESWKDIHFEALRQDLLQRFGRDSYNGVFEPDPLNTDLAAPYQNEKVRPHLLDVMDLGVEDPSPQVKRLAFSMASELAMKPIKDVATYQAWRKEIAGASLTDVVRANCRTLFTQFVQADNTTRAELLNHISAISFNSGRFSASMNGKTVSGVIATGLTGVRRNTAIASGLPDALGQCLKEGTSPALTQSALQLLIRFDPDDDFLTRYDSDMHRVLTALLTNKNQNSQWFAISTLARIKSRWATELLLKLIVDDFPDQGYQIALNALMNRKDPYCIPTLIALLDTGVEDSQKWQINTVLSQFDPSSHNYNVDADRWLEWWEKNKTKFPPDVRDLPFPKFKELVNGVSIPRRIKHLQIDNDPQRAFWLISPGILLSGASGVTVPASTTGEATVPLKDRPGLMVVLCDGDTSDLKQRSFWQDVAAKAFDGKYLIALVVPPKWNPTQKAVWVTSGNRSQVKEATFTTETFVADMVKEIKKRYPINPDRVFLHGEGDAGLAAYACSLQPQTPFHGFYLLASTFHSSELPPLANAKGRRYFLQHSVSDKTVPYFLASSAGQLLTRAGATVKLETYQGDHGYKFTGDSWQPMELALRWLEEAKPEGLK